ncbi:hypothetical protein M422DRAFT_29301 [Sphaerobolus stellatus SS14]|nr:hypothetical protein M422DRAFT_29301 [Sphaerobolus stellatus SS14]
MPKPLEIPVTILSPTNDTPQPELQPATLDDDLDRPHLAPSPITYPSRTFQPPRQPLPPHKLANIANALGVNMPMPASYRSPSPGSASHRGAPSRFLLHVIPPTYLPSDDDYDDALDPNASSVSVATYRSQFRRGTLIPLYPTLNSQLGAIAREYGLPSTGGLVLYLAHSSASSHGGAPDGPRLSEEIWKLLWFRALQAERQDSQPRAPSSLAFRSGRSTPSSPLNNFGKDFTAPRTATGYFPYASPTASSTSEVSLPLTENDAANADIINAISSELTPNPFLPILAKIEFDIDRRKATWYESWARTKRERTRWRSTSAGQLPLNLSGRAQSRSRPAFLNSHSTSDEDSRNEYQPLDDGEGERTAVDEDDELLDQATVRLPINKLDPLAEIFGSDDTTWSSIRRRNGNQEPGLIIPPGSDPEDVPPPRDEDEVVNLWEKHDRPTLPLNSRKGAPPPLNLVPQGPRDATAVGPPSAVSSTFDAERRTKRRTGIVFGDMDVKLVGEPDEMTTEDMHTPGRTSQILMKQKLDILEQQLAKLSPRKLSTTPPPVPPVPDLDNFPPRSAPPGIDRFNQDGSPSSKYPKFTRSNDATPVEGPPSPFANKKNGLAAPNGSPDSPSQLHKRGQSSQSSSGSSYNPVTPELPTGSSSNPHLPSVYTSSPSSQRQSGRISDRSPPQLVLKRSTEQEPVPVSESQDILLQPKNPNSPLIPLSPDPFGKAPVADLRHGRADSVSAESRPPSRANGTALPSAVPEEALDNQSSRFSADSEQGVEALSKQRRARSNSIMSVRSLRNLWRKSNASGKNLPPPPPTPTEIQKMPQPPPMPPQPTAVAPPRISKEEKRHSRSESRHSRAESHVSVRNSRSLAPERVRRPSVSPRPDSGGDPFQFDNVNIYKSASSTSLPTSSVLQQVTSGNAASQSQSKGILKSRTTSTSNSSDGEIKRKAPSRQRTASVASVAASERSATASVVLSERSGDSSTPSSPRSNARLSKHKQTPSHAVDPHPAFMSSSLPAASVMSYSRYPDSFAPQLQAPPSQSFLSFEDGTTPRVSEFELIPPARSTPSASYNGEIY